MASIFRTLTLSSRALLSRAISASSAAAPSMLRGFGSGAGNRTTISPFAGFLATATHSQQQIRGMKVHNAVRKRCEHCKIVQRKANKRQNGYLYVICKSNPRHKQRRG